MPNTLKKMVPNQSFLKEEGHEYDELKTSYRRYSIWPFVINLFLLTLCLGLMAESAPKPTDGVDWGGALVMGGLMPLFLIADAPQFVISLIAGIGFGQYLLIKGFITGPPINYVTGLTWIILVGAFGSHLLFKEVFITYIFSSCIIPGLIICTPSLFISFLLKNIKREERIDVADP